VTFQQAPTTPDGMTHWFSDGRVVYTHDAGLNALVRHGDDGDAAVWDHVHDVYDARDRMTLDQRGIPEHVHVWQPVRRTMTCTAGCGATFQHGLVVHPPVRVAPLPTIPKEK